MTGLLESFYAKVFLSLLSLLIEGAGMYFTYRWIVTISVVDANTRKILLGDVLSSYSNNVTTLQFIGVVFLFHSFFFMMISAAKWKRRLEIEHTNESTLKQ